MMRVVTALALVASALVSGCGQADACLKASNPADCRAWTDAGGDANDFLMGAMTGYMVSRVMQGGQQQTVIVRDPSYHGSYRPLSRPLLSRDQQMVRMQQKITRQRTELRRQQAAIQRRNSEIKTLKASSSSRSSYKPSSFSSRPSSYRSSYKSK